MTRLERSKLTRALCFIGLMQPLTMLSAFFLILLIAAGMLRPFDGPQALALVTIAFGPQMIAVGLSLWRHCDQCTKQLFAGHIVWPPRERRHSARRVWGSFRFAAMLDYARTGTTRCMWCGHEDGVEPDYVVISSAQ